MKNMRTFFTSIILFSGFLFSSAQDNYLAINNTRITDDGNTKSDKNTKKFEFYKYNSEDITKEEITTIGNHFLGQEIAYKFHLVEKLYTLKSPIGPGNPGMKTVIQKPDIYNCIYKINNYLKKQTKKGEILEEQAQMDMNHFLSVAIAVISQNTEEFEAALNSASSLAEQIKILKNTALIEL